MSHPTDQSPLSLLMHPYRSLRPVSGGRRQLRTEGRRPGAALVWRLEAGNVKANQDVAEGRPGGLPLIVILPSADQMPFPSDVANMVSRCRPAGILPHHVPSAVELSQVLRRPPEDLACEVTDYLAWRGIGLDRDTRHLLRRTVELSAQLRSITALSRSLYLSRRALGRRFMSCGLPVPSHWLQLSRLLRVTIRLQNTDDSVITVAYELGYPDGFSVSNQMNRLVGCRPNEARQFLGWEWLLEAWLDREAESGGLAPEFWTRASDEPDARRRPPPKRPGPASGRAIRPRRLVG